MIKYIGQRIRLEKGYNTKELAKKAGVAQSTISKWENGIHLPDLDALDRVAVALDVAPWHLIAYKRK